MKVGGRGGIGPSIVGRANLKKLRRISKMQFVKQERNTQNAIALLNYLKHIVPQQLMPRMQVFTKKFLSAKNTTANLLNKIILNLANL